MPGTEGAKGRAAEDKGREAMGKIGDGTGFCRTSVSTLSEIQRHDLTGYLFRIIGSMAPAPMWVYYFNTQLTSSLMRRK